jgi:hypothetical protein
MAYTTFNGWNIIPMPATPAARQIDFTIHDSVGETQSPFTMQSQVQAWPGADWWELNVSLPAMKRPAANAWIAWLMELRGKLNVFSIGDPLGAHPLGAPQGAPVCDGTSPGYNLAMSTTLFTKGWKPSTLRLLLPGDYLQVGYRLHQVAGVVPIGSDSAGKAQVSVWPSLREQPVDGQAIVLNKTTGLFRLSDNKRDWTARQTKTYTIAFKATEAR